MKKLSRKESYIKKTTTETVQLVGEVTNEHGEVYVLHYPVAVNMVISQLSRNSVYSGPVFYIAGDETDWEQFMLITPYMLMVRDLFELNSIEMDKMRTLILNYKLNELK